MRRITTGLGQALSGLPAQGILIVATGSITHNLRDYQLAEMNGGQTRLYVHEFARWIVDQLAAGDMPEALLDYRQRHRKPVAPTQAMNICCRCMSHWAQPVKPPPPNAFTPASMTT